MESDSLKLKDPEKIKQRFLQAVKSKSSPSKVSLGQNLASYIPRILQATLLESTSNEARCETRTGIVLFTGKISLQECNCCEIFVMLIG